MNKVTPLDDVISDYKMLKESETKLYEAEEFDKRVLVAMEGKYSPGKKISRIGVENIMKEKIAELVIKQS